jgi:hypothetical protein
MICAKAAKEIQVRRKGGGHFIQKKPPQVTIEVVLEAMRDAPGQMRK